MKLADLIPVLQTAIGPVILVSGVGLLLLTMTNRLGRIIDRTRQLARELRSAGGSDTERARAQLSILLSRAAIVRAAITAAALSVLLAAILIIVIFVSALLGRGPAAAVAALFVACMTALIVSLVLFIRDVNLSLQALRLEVG
ncbi:MAG TPA: DUF2721 domain-containing protein [Thermoanaerobaculia bacterium]|nr:DUF2721 domain-containing protein [Thermoanaerobaculia bacterium]